MAGSIPWRGDIFSALAQQAAARGLTRGAEYLRGQSVPRTPKQDGILRGSAVVQPASSGDLVSAVTFNTPYAVKQHEELGYRHDDGEAKYLERPLNEHRDEILEIIAAEIRRAE